MGRFVFFVLVWVSCVFPALGQITGNVISRNAFQAGGGAGDTGTDLDQDGNIDADGNISAGGNLLVGGDFISSAATLDLVVNSGAGTLAIDAAAVTVSGTLGISGTPPPGVGIYVANGNVTLGQNNSFSGNTYFESGNWRFAEDGPWYGGYIQFKGAGGGAIATSSDSGNAGDAITRVVVFEWDAPGDAIIYKDLDVLGGNFVVGSAAAGNIGTTTNPNQIEFVDETHTTIEGLLTVATVETGVWEGTAVDDTYVSDTLTIGSSSTMTSPPAIGGGTAAAGTFTTLSATGSFIRVPATITTDTTPTAAGRAVIIIGAWDTSNDITDFDNETAGQKLIIVGGDADCNVVDGAPIQLVGDSTWNATAGATLQIISDGSIWYELSRTAT